MKSIHLINLFFALLILISSVTAQDFRGAKWGMSKRQIEENAKEGIAITAMLDNGLSFKYRSNNKFLYSSLDATYIFDDGRDSLVSILLSYNDAKSKLYDNIKNLYSMQCGNPINRNDRNYWRSKDHSYVVELSTQGTCTDVTIAPSNWIFVKDIDFSQSHKEQSNNSEWKTIQTFAGSSIETTDDFTIKSSKWRIIWEVSSINNEISVLFFGGQVVGINGESETFANVTNDNSGTSVFRSKGNHYLKITSSNANWKIEVQEYSKK